MTKFVSAIIAATSLFAVAGCSTETGSPNELASAQTEDALSSCPNAQGTNAAIASFAVAYGTEAHQWQILNDFEEYRGYNYQMMLRPTATGKCANNACPVTAEILRYQDSRNDQKLVYDGEILSSYNFASRLTTGWENMRTYKQGNRFTFPSHTLNFVSMQKSTVCSTDFTYNATVASGTLDVLVNALRFTDGNGQNPYLFTYDSGGNPHLRVSGNTLTIDPTGGTSGDPSTSTSGDVTLAGCQGMSLAVGTPAVPDRVHINVTDSSGNKVPVVADGYPCACSLRRVPAGFMRLNNPNSPNTFYCSAT
jgi:hypothetical protein